MWIEKYRPENPNSMIGNEDTRLKFINWLRSWSEKSKPALLIGPPGIGKTTLVIATAKKLGFEVLELNASDVRTKTKLEAHLGPMRLNLTLFNHKILIFLDEVDGIYGHQDKGGLEFVRNLIKSSRNPLVMAANIEDNKKIMSLAKGSQVFKFKRVPPKLLEMVIRSILRKEGLTLEQDSLEHIVRNAKGDIRVAVNTAQVASSGKGEIILGIRDTRVSLAEALKIFFNSSSSIEAYLALSSCNVQPREKILAIFNSILSSGIQGRNLINALSELSKADEIVAEIGRTQNYRLLRYFDQILANSLFNSLQGLDVKYGEESLPWNLKLRIWNDSGQLKIIASQLAKLHHVSSRDAALLYLPYIALLIRIKDYEAKIIEMLSLDELGLRVLRKESQRVLQEVSG